MRNRASAPLDILALSLCMGPPFEPLPSDTLPESGRLENRFQTPAAQDSSDI
jgi:hypothetical protein